MESPLHGQCVPLFIWVGILHLLVLLPDMEGYLPITPPKSGLANHDPVP